MHYADITINILYRFYVQVLLKNWVVQQHITDWWGNLKEAVFNIQKYQHTLSPYYFWMIL